MKFPKDFLSPSFYSLCNYQLPVDPPSYYFFYNVSSVIQLATLLIDNIPSILCIEERGGFVTLVIRTEPVGESERIEEG